MPTLAALNAWLQEQCVAMWQTLPHPEWRDRTIAAVWQGEQPQLMPVPVPFDGFVEQTTTGAGDCTTGPRPADRADRQRGAV